MKEPGVALSKLEKQKLQDVLSKLRQAETTALLISSIIFSSSIAKKTVLQRELKNLLKKRIKALASGDRLILPIGYMNGDVYNMRDLSRGLVHGHAMTMEISKKGNLFDMKIYNAGEGLEVHKQGKKTGQFHPVCYQNIPATQILDDAFLTQLTKFSYRESFLNAYTALDIYQCLETQLCAYASSSKEKPYQEQRMNNCPKKAWQVWVHSQLRDCETLYRKFRCFRLERNIRSVEELCSRTKNRFSYFHPLARWGFSRSSGLIYSISQGIFGLLGGNRLRLSVPKTELQIMTDEAKTILQKRLLKT